MPYKCGFGRTRSWKSATDLHVPLRTTTLGVTKFLQGGYKTSLQTDGRKQTFVEILIQFL